MNVRPLWFVAFLVVGLITTVTQAHADTLVYVVRHAEKTSGDDPDLTPEGKQRAEDLARVLRSAKIEAAFCSQFRRTRATAEPTASAAQIEVTEHPAGKEAQLVQKIKKDFNGKNVLIAGHSNTVPLVLRAFGLGNRIRISESDYDNLFVVRVGENGTATLLHLHYGAANQ